MPKIAHFLAIGKQKEQQAKKWLNTQNVHIIAENYRCKGGEIDLIGVRQGQQKQLIFFEVKYRKSNHYGHPSEMVNHTKQTHIIHCAQHYLLTHPQYQDYPMQFDVITFTANQSHPDWIENAFQAW